MELIVLNETKKEDILPETTKRVARFIKQNHTAEYEKVLKNAEWDVFCQLTSFREGLVNWYPFKSSGRTLLLSDGFGALAGVLAKMTAQVDVLETCSIRAECIVKRYENVRNMRVMLGMTEALKQNSAYDYIVVEKTAVVKEDLHYITDIADRFLTGDGRVLFACANRLGMKYWCGVPDILSGKPFGGMRNGETAGLTRSSLMDILGSDPDKGWKIYYPFPDEYLPQAIYTDEYLPQAGIRDRVIFYYTPEQKDSMVFLEDSICDDLIANGIFQVFANSFLVEYAKSDFSPAVRYAALSTDRGKEHGYATIIYQNDVVRKKALHSQGVESLKRIYRNHQELERHGIICIKQQMFGNYIEMPFVKGKTLIEYLKESYEKGKKNEIIDMFDILYEDILNSSEHISFSECALKNRRLNEHNIGTVLQAAYIDMIPYNCFFREGRFVFYDQEFVREKYPAKYVLFRALRYTYFYIKEAESVISLQFFKEKYDLDEIWEVFEQEEAEFVEDNRNYDLLAAFYKWAGTRQSDIDENIKRLQG